MRALFGVLSLVLVVAVIGFLARKQLSSVAAPPLAPALPGSTATTDAKPATPQQTVQQFQQAVQGQMQQPRPMPDDPK